MDHCFYEISLITFLATSPKTTSCNKHTQRETEREGRVWSLVPSCGDWRVEMNWNRSSYFVFSDRFRHRRRLKDVLTKFCNAKHEKLNAVTRWRTAIILENPQFFIGGYKITDKSRVNVYTNTIQAFSLNKIYIYWLIFQINAPIMLFSAPKMPALIWFLILTLTLHITRATWKIHPLHRSWMEIWCFDIKFFVILYLIWSWYYI